MANRGAEVPPVGDQAAGGGDCGGPDIPSAGDTSTWLPHSAGTAAGEPQPAEPEAPRSPRSALRRAVKITLILSGGLILVIAGLASAAYLTANHYLSNMKRIHNPFASIPAAARPPRPAGAAAGDVTFLVGGLDTRSAVPTTGDGAAGDIRGRTDTLMLVHLIAGGRGAYVVSIPRDSWVPIPGYGDGKVNWAYFFGGPSLAVRTVEQFTHVRIDHVAVIDWAGFRAVTNALGGVTINIPVTSYDPANRVTWTAGVHHLDGEQALLYVRDRYGLQAGDLGRERRQQNYLRAVFQQLRDAGTLGNPLRTASVLRALSQAVSVDTTVTNATVTRMALGLRGLNQSSIVFATAPNTGTGSVGDQSVVWLNSALGAGFWHAFEYDSLPAYMAAHKLKRLGAATE